MMRSDNRLRRTTRTGRLVPSRLLVFRTAALAFALAATGSTGCSLVHNFAESLRYSDVWNDAAGKFRYSAMSSKSWHRHKHQFCNEACLDDFCAGYRAGYEDVAGGTNGCTPAFPPREYWGWKYQSAEGQKKVASWFAGYPHGARAAEEEGVGNWSQIQMSSTMQSQYVTAGVFPNKGHAVYPITEPACCPSAGGPTPAGTAPGAPLPSPVAPEAVAPGLPVPGATWPGVPGNTMPGMMPGATVPGAVEIPNAGLIPGGAVQPPGVEAIPAIPGFVEPAR